MSFKSESSNRRPTYIGRMFGDTDGVINAMNPPFTLDPEGINLYLRLGTLCKFNRSKFKFDVAFFFLAISF